MTGQPPEGWFFFGTHTEHSGKVEFSVETDEALMPLYERPSPPIQDGDTVTTPCPTCGVVAERTGYDIGSGAELACSNCEWCWGANGQGLKPLPLPDDIARRRRM